MKKILFFGLALCSVSSCSFLERSPEHHMEAEAAGPIFGPAETAETLQTLAGTPGSMESEISRLNTKVSALETKLDVLTANMERVQLQRSQPVIEANSSPQMNMAVPVEEEMEDEFVTSQQISAAPVRPAVLPQNTKNTGSLAGSEQAERDFKSAMELFQNGRNLEAANRFSGLAKKHPRHLLAAHALYWAGEASARAEQWSMALDNWTELEQTYPRSTYIPEALAGLARAYEKQGDLGKAKSYRDNLLKAFPQSPTAMQLQIARNEEVPVSRPASRGSSQREIPAYEEETFEEGEE